MTPFAADDLRHLQEAREHIVPSFEIPETTHGWQEHLLNTQELFRKLSPLRVKQGYQFRCFLTAMVGNASSRLYAVPFVKSEQPPASQAPPATAEEVLSGETPAKPEQLWNMAAGVSGEDAFREPVLEGALDHFMLAVEGDDSPIAYLLASFLARDGEEFAASWHGLNWRSENLLLKSPFWTPERIRAIADEVVDANIRCGREAALDYLLEVREYPPRPDDKLWDRVLDLCEERPEFLSEIIVDYWFGLESFRKMRFESEYGREPDKEEQEALKVEIPPEWQAARRLPTTPLEKWTWSGGTPTSWCPQYQMTEKEVEIQFLTHTELGRERVVRHTDRFQRGCYLPQRASEIVGTGRGGYIH